MRTNYLKIIGSYAEPGMYEFARHVTLDRNESYQLRIFTTGRYILYINNTYVCEGPCKCHANVRYYDEVETGLLKKGENNIRIRVLHPESHQFCTVFHHPCPMLLFEAVSLTNRITGDLAWTCRRDNRYAFFYLDDQLSLPPGEEVSFDLGYTSFPLEIAGGYQYETGYDFDKGLETFGGVVRAFPLEKRPIPISIPQPPLPLSVIRIGDGFLDLDAGSYVTAKVSFCLSKESHVKILYSECYETPDGKQIRDDSSGFLRGYYDVVHTGSEDRIYEPFWYKAFRFIRIETEHPEQVLKSAHMKLFHYPLEMEGSFHCSDDIYNQMYEVSVNTMLCCMMDTFMDCPHYEQQQYIMDSAIESNILMQLTSDHRLIQKCIDEFAASQMPCGLLRCNYPNMLVQVIPGFSLFWIFLLQDYLNASGDAAFVRKYLGTMDRILAYFAEQVREKGYISDSIYWDYVDWVPAWNMGIPNLIPGEPHTIYNLYYARALLCAEDICRKTGRPGQALDYRADYESLKLLIRKHCYDSDRKLFRDSGPGSGFSTHTIIWAILAELAEGEEANAMLLQLSDEQLSKSSFSMNFYLFRALEKSGHRDWIFQHYDGWKKMLDLHCTSWCENPDSPRSECHGWSSAPLYDFAANILGVTCSFEEEICIKPTLLHLTNAAGTVPTRFGPVTVSWKADSMFSIEISAPPSIRKTVFLPDGTMVSFEGANAGFSSCISPESSL